MDKIKKSLVICMILTLLFSAGCSEKSDPDSDPKTKVNDASSLSEEATAAIETAEEIDFFKQGKWISSKGIYYFFDSAKGYLDNRDEPDASTGFSYELNKDGTAVFHMDKTGSSQNASVDFKKPGVIDIIWENEDTETLNFDTEEIPDNITQIE